MRIKDIVLEDKRDLCLFRTADITYSVEIEYVTDIIEKCPITFVPCIPPHMRGIINLRGKIVPIMDLRIKLNPDKNYTINDEYPPHACIVVVRREEVSCGLLVEEVLGIEPFSKDGWAEVPNKNSMISHILCTDNGMIHMLETMKLQTQF